MCLDCLVYALTVLFVPGLSYICLGLSYMCHAPPGFFSAQIFRDAVAGVYQSERVDWAAPDTVAEMFHATRHYRLRVSEIPEEKGPLHVRAYISV